MPFFVDGDPTPSEISEAINYLLSNFQQSSTTNIDTGQITDSTGNVQSYLYKYLYVKYADSFDGTLNFSNTPTSRQYYGLRNNDSATESTNPADYIWYKVSGGFGTTKLLYYSVTGGRRIDIVVSMSAPSGAYQPDTGPAINLDQISGSDGNSSRICYAKSTSTSLSSTPATYQTSGPSSFPPYNTWGGSETWQATPYSLAVNEALFQSDGIYNPITDLTTWNSPYLSTLKVGSLSAISANMGTITAGTLTAGTVFAGALSAATGTFSGSLSAATGTYSGDVSVGSSPAISGTTMTGTGTRIYNDGRIVAGNSTKNFTFDGSVLTINGDLVATGNIVNNAITTTVSQASSTSFTFTAPSNANVVLLITIVSDGVSHTTTGTGLITATATLKKDGSTIKTFNLGITQYYVTITNLLYGVADGTMSYVDVGDGSSHTYSMTIPTGVSTCNWTALIAKK